MPEQFKLPELGENVESGTVTKILVSEGDTLEENQPVLEIETDKAVLEVPSTVAGKVTKIHAQEGQAIEVGTLVLEVSADGAPKAKEGQEAQEPAAESKEPAAVEEESAPAAEEAPAAKDEAKKPGREPAEARAGKESGQAPKAEGEEAEKQRERPAAEAKASKPEADGGEQAESRQEQGPVPAAPSVRGFAREIGVDINDVPGTGPGGRISIQDVKEYARRVNIDVRGVTSTGKLQMGALPLPDFARFGEIERQPMTTVRRRTAENLTATWTTVPQVTQFDKVDITQLEKLRKQFSSKVEEAGGKLTITAIIAKVVAAALKKYPRFNASIDVENNELILKKYYGIGIAVDTERGLLVPVVRDANKKNLTELSVEITAMAERARNKKTALDEMQGGTFTLSNLGGIGGTGFTPVVNSPEAAILGIARARTEPVYVNGSFEPRMMLPLALTYDHRIIDGADGARFLRWIVEALEQPFLLFLEG